MNSCLVLINPNRTPHQIHKLKKILSSNHPVEIMETANREAFLKGVADFCKSPLKHLLVWGGDGTAHDAINVLMEHSVGKKKSIGFLRGGSGNGIQDSYEVPFCLRSQIKAYLESIQKGYTVEVDLLQIENGNRKEYGQLMGIGFDVRLLQRRNNRKHSSNGQVKAGFWNYFLSGVLTFLTEPLRDGRIYQLDFEEGKYALRGTRINAETPFTRLHLASDAPMIELGTRPYYGRLFKVCPDVVCNRGFLEAYLFNFQTKWDVARDINYLWNGWHHRINRRFARQEKPIIQRFEVKKAWITSEEPFPYHTDGELRLCDQQSVPPPLPGMESFSTQQGYTLRIEIVPKVLNFLVPGVFYRKFHPFDQEAILIP